MIPSSLLTTEQIDVQWAELRSEGMSIREGRTRSFCERTTFSADEALACRQSSTPIRFRLSEAFLSRELEWLKADSCSFASRSARLPRLFIFVTCTFVNLCERSMIDVDPFRALHSGLFEWQINQIDFIAKSNSPPLFYPLFTLNSYSTLLPRERMHR